MKEITLAVSPMVRKIFLSRYGEEPIRIHRSDAVYHYLQGDPIRPNKSKYKKLHNLLTTSLTIRVSDSVHERLQAKERCITVGYYLHKVFQEEMLVYVHAQHQAGVPAQTALKDFLDRNNITEDDYSLETAYTAWKRKKDFFKKKARVFTEKAPQSDPPPIPGNAEDISPTPSRIIWSCKKYFACRIKDLLCRPNKPRQVGEDLDSIHYKYLPRRSHRFRKIMAYLLHEDAGMSGVEITRYIRRSPRRVQEYIQEVRIQARIYEDIQEDLRHIRATYGG